MIRKESKGDFILIPNRSNIHPDPYLIKEIISKYTIIKVNNSLD